jgi:hypothetical protein
MNRKLIALTLLLLSILLSTSAVEAQTSSVPCTAPGISFWKLIESVAIGYSDGRLSIGKLYAVCLPMPVKQVDSPYPYNPDGPPKLSTLVKTADGKVVNTYVWYAQMVGGLWELSTYKVLGGYQAEKQLSAGNYLLEFAIDDKTFTRFPFSVVEAKNDDPYQAAGSRYFIEGAWNEYGNLFYQRNDPQSALSFTTWVQDKRGNQKETTATYEALLINRKDGKTLGQDSGKLQLEPWWLQLRVNLHPAGGDKNAYLKAADLLRQDGSYAIRFTLDGKLYGEYPFVVKDGLIQLQGKQVREKTDPKDYIVDYLSGGRFTSWWITRESKPAR